MKKGLKLKEGIRARVTIIVDNYINILLSSNDKVKRPPLTKDGIRIPPPLAEHGYSVLVEVFGNTKKHSVMMDFGFSEIAVPNNIELLGIDLSEIDAFVVSHGHPDHIGAIGKVLSSLSNKPRPVIVHPDAFIDKRFHKFADGRQVPIPSLRYELIEETGNEVVDGSKEVLLCSDYILALGEIPRLNDFEKGMPSTYYEKDAKTYKDYIADDKGVVFAIKNKGLVIISGCGHSGIINTIYHAKKITGIDSVYGVIGGFHLIGEISDYVIEKTIAEMKKINPRIIVPCHCVGLKAIRKFEKELPVSFILSSSGSKVIL